MKKTRLRVRFFIGASQWSWVVGRESRVNSLFSDGVSMKCRSAGIFFSAFDLQATAFDRPAAEIFKTEKTGVK
jgi:hypothetical protein